MQWQQYSSCLSIKFFFSHENVYQMHSLDANKLLEWFLFILVVTSINRSIDINTQFQYESWSINIAKKKNSKNFEINFIFCDANARMYRIALNSQYRRLIQNSILHLWFQYSFFSRNYILLDWAQLYSYKIPGNSILNFHYENSSLEIILIWSLSRTSSCKTFCQTFCIYIIDGLN